VRYYKKHNQTISPLSIKQPHRLGWNSMVLLQEESNCLTLKQTPSNYLTVEYQTASPYQIEKLHKMKHLDLRPSNYLTVGSLTIKQPHC
jgi:hypothetical protein